MATSAPAAAGLQAVVSPDGAEFPSSQAGTLTVTIRNDGAEPATLQMDILRSGILSLDVFDADGKRIPTIPPPMPLTPEEMKRAQETLPPGQSRKLTYTLHMFSPQLPPGQYTVRMRGMPSNAARFTIRPGR
ncbi:MAG: hypothetical protein JRI68_10110 [Deltaproteobacteria bacterium]|nr:hypothetical protein [Deltaproteobacteria bacterium]